MSYGADVPDIFRRGALIVHEILQGAKPADLPVELPTKFELVINLKDGQGPGPRCALVPSTARRRGDRVKRRASVCHWPVRTR